ncbi:MAG: hypothetical protein ACJAZS_000768 [Alteromonas naphthalenivorans]|jgi:hypothetical protein
MKRFLCVFFIITYSLGLYAVQKDQAQATSSWTTESSPNSSSNQGSSDTGTSAWTTSNPSQGQQASQSSGWKTDNSSNTVKIQTSAWKNTKPNYGGSHTVTQAWPVRSQAETMTSIYGTDAYGTVSLNLPQLQDAITKIMQYYRQENNQQQSSWGDSKQSSSVTEQYNKYFLDYMNHFADTSDSYLAAVRLIFQGYKQLPQMYEQQLQQRRESPDTGAIKYFKTMPFSKDSFALELVQEAVGSALDYLRMRIKSITVDNYKSEISQSFLLGKKNVPSHFSQLLHAVDAFEGICESYFKQLKDVKGITKAELDELENNYAAIFTSYEQESSNLMIALSLRLFKEINRKYPVDLALHADVIKMDVDLPMLKELYALSKSGLEVLVQVSQKKEAEKRKNQQEHRHQKESAKTYFGTYSSPKDVLEALGGMMGNILTYGATVEQNLINQQVQEKNLEINVSAVQHALSTASLLYLQAAGCYRDAGNNHSYSAYGTIGKSFSLVAQSWIKAQRHNRPGTYGFAAEQYQIAYEAAKQGGITELSFLLLRFYNMAMLEYAQYSLNQYAQFGQYQNDISTYVKHAATIPQGTKDSQEPLVQNLFYSQGSTALKGIGGLCAQVAESYKASLSSLQATKSSIHTNKKLLLQNGITVAQNVSNAAKAMLVRVPATETEAAKSASDESIYKYYYNAESVFYGQQRYLDVFQGFRVADTALQQAPNNHYAPLQALFAQSPIKTFTGFAQLHFARICLMSALEARAYISNPKYAYYKNSCIVSSFLSFLCAYKVYRYLGKYNQLTEYCTQQLEEFKPLLSVIIGDAQKKVQNQKATQFDYQMALAQTQGAALLGDDQALQIYENIIQQYAQQLGNNAFGMDFPGIEQAYTYYQGYLLSLHKKNQPAAQKYQQMIVQSLQAFMGQVERARKSVNSVQMPFDKRIAIQKQLKNVQDLLEHYSITQEYEQALFGVEKNDFCNMKHKQATQKTHVPSITISFIGGIRTSLANPLYQLAQLYTGQSNRELQEAEQNFNSTSPNYGLLTTSRFKNIMENYQTALLSYGQLGLQNKVMQVEQNMTRAAAFRYFSSVIPSDQVRKKINLSQQAQVYDPKKMFQGSSSSNTGAWKITPPQQQEANTSRWSVSGNKTQDASGTSAWTKHPEGSEREQKQIKKPSLLPYYVLAEWEVNVSKLAASASAVAQQASQQTSEGTSIPSSMVDKQKLYSQILTTAQKLIGKKESLQDIVEYVALPLFKDELQAGGFEGVFRTVDQEVVLYQKQLVYLLTHGMQIGGSTLKATLKLITQKDPSTGRDDIVLQGTNMPLASIPRYRGDNVCAVFYYSLYRKFFNQSGQPVDVGGTIFFPITGPTAKNSNERGERETDRAYLASSLQYQQKIAYLVEPLKNMSSEQRFNSDFKKYAKVYNQLKKAYEWEDALISAIDFLQKKAGLGYVEVGQRQSALYKSWAEDCRLFLFGAPFSPSYIKVLGDIQGYYGLAAQYSTSPKVKSQFYKEAAQLNIIAAQMCIKTAQILPQVDGYPSARPTGFPSLAITGKKKQIKYTKEQEKKALTTLHCSTAPSYSMPRNDSVAWKHYEDAQMHYKEALKLYKQALSAENTHQKSGSHLSDSTIRALTGLSLMCHIRASIQRIALFTRNAWKVSMQTKGDATGYSADRNPYFEKIRADGSSGGGISAVSGEQSLVSGTGKQSSGNAVSQYILMKKMLLDAIIYITPVTNTTESISNSLGSLSVEEQKTTIPTLTSQAVICACAYNIPNLTATLTNKKGESTQVGIEAFYTAAQDITLNKSLTEISKIMLLYADTFPSFVEYTVNDLIGNESNNFERLGNNLQISALNNFSGQLYGLYSNLYKETFLPELMSQQAGKVGIEKAQTSFQTALKSAEQKMLVNATGYLG